MANEDSRDNSVLKGALAVAGVGATIALAPRVAKAYKVSSKAIKKDGLDSFVSDMKKQVDVIRKGSYEVPKESILKNKPSE